MTHHPICESRPQWRSATSYLLVTIGAVVGLGNVVQFPFLVSKYGGLFILLFILFEFLVSIPLFLAELFIGRTGKQNPVGSIGILTTLAGAQQRWRLVGWFSFVFVLVTLSYYTVQAAFPLNYFISSMKIISLYGIHQKVPVAVHGDLMTNFLPLELCFIVFLLLTLWIIVRGIHRGLETISWVVVPTYFLIILCLAVYTCIRGEFLGSLKVLFSLQSDHHFFIVLFAAMSYALFKLGVGLGTIIVYGSYIPYSVSYGKSTLIIVCFDAVISLLSFFIIYPLILQSNHLISGLNNHTVIHLFTTVPNGVVIACFYFLAAMLAAWTCTIAMAETATVTLIERFSLQRHHAVLIVLLAALCIGTVSTLTHTQWANDFLFHSIPVFALVKNITGNVIAPIAAFLIAIFAGWIIRRDISSLELGFKPFIYSCWLFSVRYLAPIIIIAVSIANGYALFFRL